ncbi:MAG: tetratricopeptide repeat protein [Candidatus Omnitrophica bacterium]|nr:tetratricopeptide repeat protein [Candidatus Omnitrophota bacterium]
MNLRRMGWRHSLAVVFFVTGVALRQAAALEVTEAYAALQHAFLREEFQAVATLAQTFLVEHPDAPEAPRVRLWQALSLDRLERSAEALEALDGLRARLTPDDPLWAELLYWEGDICRRTFQMMRSKLAFQRLLERYPDSSWAPMAQLGLGLIYAHQQAFELARQRFHQLALQKAGSPIALDARLYEGFCNLRLARFQETVNILQPLLEQLEDPTEAQAAFYLGEALTGLERYGPAIDAYRQATKSAEPSTWSRLALFGAGWAGFRAGRCDESIEAFERYLSLQIPDHRTEALFAQASCLSQVGRQREALSLFGQVIDRDPDHPLALESGLILVDAYRQQERFTPARQLLHTMLRRRLDARGRAHVQLRLGAIALDQGNAAQAQTVYQLAAASVDPTIRQAALSGLGDIQIFLGNLDEAQRLYEEAAKRSEHTPVAMRATYQLGRIHLQRRAFDKAAAIFRQLVERPTAGLVDDARLALALTSLNQGETNAARAALEAIRGQRPGSVVAARAAYYLALLMLERGEEDAAERLCRETIARAPRAEEAADARLLLADVLARRTSVRDAMGWLKESLQSPNVPWRHRARIAKRIGDFAREEGAYVEAIRWYDEAMRLLPSLRGEATYRTASCYEDGGDHELAMRWYQAVPQPPWTIRGQLALAKLLERHDRLREATAIYELLAREPIPEAAVVRERLAALRGASPNEE